MKKHEETLSVNLKEALDKMRNEAEEEKQQIAYELTRLVGEERERVNLELKERREQLTFMKLSAGK